MNATKRLSIAALVVACLHLVFGAIVRISGSGMGCGDHWPKCYGYWFPPFNRPDLIVEVSHRYLASILTLTVLSMAFVAWRNRGVAGIGGRGGAMRSAFGAVAAVFSAAILGGVTVKMGNAPWATVAHWLVAMTLLAMVATTAIRAGALGGASSLVQRGTHRARRSAFAAAGMAIFAVALGGLTAKYPGAAVGCTTVPLCGANPAVEKAGVHIQLTHRTIAVVLVLHLIGIVMMLRKRRDEEAPVVVRAAHIALGMVLLQLVVASSMVLFHLPPVLRSLHEATGVGIWLSCFALAYLARRASSVEPQAPAVTRSPEPVLPPVVPPAPAPIAPIVIQRDEPAATEPSPVFEASTSMVVDEAVDFDAEVRESFNVEELDWEPKRRASVDADAEEDEEIESLLAEADLAEAELPVEEVDPSVALASLELTRDDRVEEPVLAAVEPVVEQVAAPVVQQVIEQVTGDTSIVAPPVVAPKLSPLPAPTMAVLVARGADML